MKDNSNRKRTAFIIAGTGSSSGKTVVTLGLLKALEKRGVTVQPFKAGPDYIDPGHHRALLKTPSYNLDTWMMGAEAVRKTFYGKMAGAGAGVIEGVMGLFDGRDGASEEGSTAHLSKLLGLPVLLVVNAEKTARSAGAVIKGFESFDPGVRIRWVIFNKVGSERHFKILRDAVPGGSKIEVIGYMPKDAALVLPERHLGLITPGDLKGREWAGFLKAASSELERHAGIDAFLKTLPALKMPEVKTVTGRPGPGITVAVARDNAFCFCYEENLEILKSLGAKVVFFSPLKDKKIPRCGGVYLTGGYPEVYARALEANHSMRDEIRRMAGEGLPIYAECGGLMYLGKNIVDRDGRAYSMAGVFPWTSRMLSKRKALGYREVEVSRTCPVKCAGVLKGHEYHYSELVNANGIKRAYMGAGGGSCRGYVYKNTVASYIHLHFAGNPAFAEGFVKLCMDFIFPSG